MLRYKNVGDAQFVFDYFGEDYTVSFSGKVARKSSKLIYQNCYRFPGAEEYLEAEEKRKRLEDSVRKAKEKSGRFSQLLSLIGFLYLLFGILSILGDMLFSCVGALDAFIESNMSIGILAAPPYVLYSLILGIFDDLSDKMVIFLVVILLGTCLIGMLFCFSCFRSYGENVKALKLAKKELNSLIKSADYKEITAENEELRKKNEDLAEQWHRAWYKWVCSIKDSAAEAQENWTEKDEAESKAFEAAFDRSAFEEQVANTDFNELLKRKKGENTTGKQNK